MVSKQSREEKCKNRQSKLYRRPLAKEAEDAAARGNMKLLCDTTRKLAGNFKQADMPIKDTNVVILISEEEQTGIWSDHFEGLLN